MSDGGAASVWSAAAMEAVSNVAQTGHDTLPPVDPPLGARVLDGSRCEFRVWAPFHERVDVHIVTPHERLVPLKRTDDGYHAAILDDCGEGARYLYAIGDRERPDPASRHQPDGVHGPSEVIGADFEWHDEGWTGVALEDYVLYELHVGTFTPEGTLDAIIPRLDALKDLGVTAIELLPIGQFPGGRNWGYDGTYVAAVQNTYGGPRALKRLVDACHQRGVALLLDVVYNHLGPEGNYLAELAPYFTDRYRTPWGPALNFDGPQSDHVRWFFIHNALQWIDEFHIDGLRVDAVHAVIDHSAEPFLQDLTAAVRDHAHELARRVYLIAESDLNDPRVITPAEELGLGFDSQWSDDYHHALHVLLTGEGDGYYQGFPGRVSDLARVMSTGYLYIGQHSPYRGRKYGLHPRTRDGAKFVVSSQNHDQIGNRMMGERLAALVSIEKVRLAAAAVVLSPFLPLLFMGEEYGELAPWQYFTSHGDADLTAAVRKGRREEFDDFEWHGDPPDPHDEATFERSKLNWSLQGREEHASLRRLYKELFRLRREVPALRSFDLRDVDTIADDERNTLLVRRDNALLAFNFSEKTQTMPLPFSGPWRALIDGGATITEGRIRLSPWAFGVFGPDFLRSAVARGK